MLTNFLSSDRSNCNAFCLALLPALGINENKKVKAQSVLAETNIEEIIDNTNEWIGKKITIKGTFNEAKDNNSFTIENDAYLDSDRVLIVNNTGKPLPKIPGQNVPLRITVKC